MILKFKGIDDQWVKLEQIIPGSKETLKTIVQKLLKNKLQCDLYRESKNKYTLKTRDRIVVEMIARKDNDNKYLQINIVDYNKFIKIADVYNIDEFNNIFNNWYEEYIKNPTPKRMIKSYIRKEIYKIEDVLSKTIINEIKDKSNYIKFDGDMIRMNSDRYKTFATSGIYCINCGLKAKYFAKERYITSSKYHFNLYGINDENEEILFTKDHIIPKSKGGKDELTNYQTMCCKCNSKKGNDIQEIVV